MIHQLIDSLSSRAVGVAVHSFESAIQFRLTVVLGCRMMEAVEEMEDLEPHLDI